MDDYQERVKQERIELNEKLKKLFVFILSDDFMFLDEKEQELLNTQFVNMVSYSTILRQRIEYFYTSS